MNTGAAEILKGVWEGCISTARSVVGSLNIAIAKWWSSRAPIAGARVTHP